MKNTATIIWPERGAPDDRANSLLKRKKKFLFKTKLKITHTLLFSAHVFATRGFPTDLHRFGKAALHRLIFGFFFSLISDSLLWSSDFLKQKYTSCIYTLCVHTSLSLSIHMYVHRFLNTFQVSNVYCIFQKNLNLEKMEADTRSSDSTRNSRRYSDLMIPVRPPGLNTFNKHSSPAPSSLKSLVDEAMEDRVDRKRGVVIQSQGISFPEYEFLVKRVMNLRKRLIQRVKKADVTLRTLYGESVQEDTYKTKANCRAIGSMIRKCSMVLGMSTRRIKRLDERIKARCCNLQVLLSVLGASTVNLQENPLEDPHYKKMIADNPLSASIDFHRARLKFLHDAVKDAKREALRWPVSLSSTAKETLADNVVDAENQAEDASDRLLKQYVQFHDAITTIVVPDETSRSKMPFAARKSSLDNVLLRMLVTKFEMQGRTVLTLERWSKLHERFELLRQDANKLEKQGHQRIEGLNRQFEELRRDDLRRVREKEEEEEERIRVDISRREQENIEFQKRRAGNMFSRAQEKIVFDDDNDMERRQNVRREEEEEENWRRKYIEQKISFIEKSPIITEERKQENMIKTTRRPPPPASPFDSELEREVTTHSITTTISNEHLFDSVLKSILKKCGRMFTATMRKMKGFMDKQCDENGTIDVSSFEDCVCNKCSVVLSFTQIRDIFEVLGPGRISVDIFVKHIKDAFKRKTGSKKKKKKIVKQNNKKSRRPRMVFSTSTSDIGNNNTPPRRRRSLSGEQKSQHNTSKEEQVSAVARTTRKKRPPPPTTAPPPRWVDVSDDIKPPLRFKKSSPQSIGKWMSTHRSDFIKSFEEAHRDLLG